MMGTPEMDAARRLLEENRGWSAYALADMDPTYVADTEWLVEGGAVVLLYKGLSPRVLFVDGEPSDARRALERVPAGPVQFTLLGVHRSLLRDRLRPEVEAKMWRMVLHPEDFPGPTGLGCVPLTTEELPQIEALMDRHSDRPDAFSKQQLESGLFYGAWVDNRLVSMAGIHVLSEAMNVAALGNVFTHPAYRGRGLGRAVSAAVTAALIDRGLDTIVLNVAMDNLPALHLYEDLGYRPFCGYYEGVGRLDAVNDVSQIGRME